MTRLASRLRGGALLAALIWSLAALGGGAATATAKPKVWSGTAKTRMPGPTTFSTGLVDDPTFELADASVRNPWLLRAQQLGSGFVRLTVPWFAIAPRKLQAGFDPANAADPRYNWTFLDEIVREVAAHRQQMVLMVLDAPTWAYGANPPSATDAPVWHTDPAAFGAFAHALAERYSGWFPDPLRPGHALPRAGYFQAWNEPNLRLSVLPQWTLSNGQWLPASPYWYRRMLNAFYANVKAAQPRAKVLVAGLAPYGDPPGVDRMPPVEFLRELLCLNSSLRPEPCPDPPHFDAIDEHPYALTPTIPARHPDDVSVPDMYKLANVLAAARRFHTALPGGRKDIWMTEIEWTAKPSDPNGVSLGNQAKYLSLSFYEVWRQGISHAFWFLLRDYPFYKSLRGSGLYFLNGRAKPSAQAFGFPFAAVPAPIRTGLDQYSVRRKSKRATVFALWGRAPRRGRVAIQIRLHGRWRTIWRVNTTRGGVFYVERPFTGHPYLRAQLGRTFSFGYRT